MKNNEVDPTTFRENLAVVYVMEKLVKALEDFNGLIPGKSAVKQLLEECLYGMCDQIKNNIKSKF